MFHMNVEAKILNQTKVNPVKYKKDKYIITKWVFHLRNERIVLDT